MSSSLDPLRRDAIRSGAIDALLELPETIDRYLIRGELGRGGMGVVYDAIDPQLARPVAIKVINPELLQSPTGVGDLEERFEREMRAVSPIFHPNVVTILDAGIANIGGIRAAYYVMERVVGESLEDRIRRSGPLEGDDALAVATGVAKGLAALHAQGLVHRDVKPSNVLLPIGQGPKVSDFGLVHLINDSPSDPAEAVIAGSAHGLAPEQIHSQAVDGRTDLFALGALLIRLWTGDEPFAASRLSDRLRRIEWDEPDGIDALPAEVAALARKLLAKSPGERPESAREVADALEAMGRRRGSWWSALVGPVVAISGVLVAAFLLFDEWRGIQIDEEILREQTRHEMSVDAQLERAGLLSPSLLTPSLHANLPADERRAAHDRLEGIVNRIAFERSLHAERLDRLEEQRKLRPSDWFERWLGQSPVESRADPSRVDTASPAARFARVIDPHDRLTSDEQSQVAHQIDLLEREFGLAVQVQFATELDAGERDRWAMAPSHSLRLRILLDVENRSGQVETSQALEAALPDALVGALLREQILPLVARGEAAFGLRLAFRVLRARLREGPREVPAPTTRDANWPGPDIFAFAGGGARAQFSVETAGLDTQLDAELRASLSAGPTVEATWQKFLVWLSLETHDAEVGFLTPASREIARRWPASRPYWRSMRREAPDAPLVVLERGDRALLYSKNDHELAPSFFRRTAAGWQLDLEASRDHLLAVAGGDRHWSFHGVGAPPLAAFIDDLAVVDGLIRISRVP